MKVADPAVPYKIVPPQHSQWGGKKGARGKKILFALVRGDGA